MDHRERMHLESQRSEYNQKINIEQQIQKEIGTLEYEAGIELREKNTEARRLWSTYKNQLQEIKETEELIKGLDEDLKTSRALQLEAYDHIQRIDMKLLGPSSVLQMISNSDQQAESPVEEVKSHNSAVAV